MNAIEIVQRSNKAYNAHDADALAATYAEDATYSNPRAGKGLTGKAIANYAKAVWTAYPDASVELITVGDGRRLGRRPMGVAWHEHRHIT
jgi:hypothetical protein